MKHYGILSLVMSVVLTLCASCIEPPLHLPEESPEVQLELEVSMDIDIDVETEWHYGWDDTDRSIFGELTYTEPTSFNIRRYFTDQTPNAPHTTVLEELINQRSFTAQFPWGFWDILAWNDIYTLDGVQSLRFDEETSLDYVTASTGQTMFSVQYDTKGLTKQTRSYYQPEQLFSAYERAFEVNQSLEGFTYDAERNVYVKKVNLKLQPLTYIYLTQVIVHNNRGRITGVDGNANLSGMAQSVNLNTGVAGSTPVTVHYNVRFKTNCDKQGESVDIAGGRLITFGMCNINGNKAGTKAVDDGSRHYMDVNMQFYNGKDSTIVFDVTDQVRSKPRGGVLTVELDADTIKIPTRSGGSGFDAVVKDFEDGGTHEFEM